MQSPVNQAATDSLLLGDEIYTMDSRPRGPVRLPISTFSRHVHVVGTTGSGKSTTAKLLCLELAEQKVPITVLDRTGEYVDALAELVPEIRVLKPGENLSIPLFGRDGQHLDDLPAQVENWVSLLDHYYRVTYEQDLPALQARIIRTVLFDWYHNSKETLSVSGLVAILEEFEKKVKELHGWPESIEAMISRLWPLTVSKVGATFNRKVSIFDVGQFFEPKLTVVDLSVLPDDSARNLLSQVVMKEVYEETRRRGKVHGGVALVFLIDEAHHVCPNQKGYISIPERCAIELRKYGFSLITCATRPVLVSPNIIANSNTLICHMLNNQEDVDEAAGFLIGGSSIRESVRRLPVGEALVQVNTPVPLQAIRCRMGTMEQRARMGIA